MGIGYNNWNLVLVLLVGLVIEKFIGGIDSGKEASWYRIAGDIVVNKEDLDRMKLLEDGIDYSIEDGKVIIDSDDIDISRLEDEGIGYSVIGLIIIDSSLIDIKKLDGDGVNYSMIGGNVVLDSEDIDINKIREYRVQWGLE